MRRSEWLPYYIELDSHPKIRKLSRKVGLTYRDTLGLVSLLWIFAARYAPDGDIGRQEPQAVADAVEWDSEPERLLAELRACRLLDDDGRLHDWDDYYGKRGRERESNADRQRRFREAHATENTTREDNRYVGTDNSYVTAERSNITPSNALTLSNTTGPDSTGPAGDQKGESVTTGLSSVVVGGENRPQPTTKRAAATKLPGLDTDAPIPPASEVPEERKAAARKLYRVIQERRPDFTEAVPKSYWLKVAQNWGDLDLEAAGHELMGWLASKANTKRRTLSEAFIDNWLRKEQQHAREGTTNGTGRIQGAGRSEDRGRAPALGPHGEIEYDLANDPWAVAHGLAPKAGGPGGTSAPL